MKQRDYDQATMDELCERLSEGESLRKICKDEHMPNASTVTRWLADTDNELLRTQYARARELQADKMADDILAIADNGENDTYIDANGIIRTDQEVIGRSRLRVDTRKWLASKMYPKRYGEKVQQEISGGLTVRSATELKDDELAAIATRSGS